ncbi:hypothetical protein LTR62_005359 [Meristemomyces frigidus]|uniref:Rhodopsin domain-containing protein n=1 Tax=Meristemomyces frigidus TaxID=1508187 RepID=A0AAN7TEB8_9PEZI|nr:hypothetical protein LTR62_005359 [Meristemomyces frigidus]
MVGMRLWLRSRKQAGGLGLDDALLVPGYVAATGFSALIIIGNLHYGVDRHIWDVPPAWFEAAVLLAWLTELFFTVSSCATKISVLLFYRRLTKGTISKRWKGATIGAIVFTAAYGLALILALVFNCRPTNAYWKVYSDHYHEDYTCSDTKAINPLAGALSVFSDFYAVFLPMLMLRHFDIPHRQKVALNLVFSLGLLVGGAGIARTYYLWQLGYDYDITFVGYRLLMSSVLELQIGLICASAPALRVFFRQYLAEPFSRALNTARTDRGESRVGKRDSSQVAQSIDSYTSHRRSGSLGAGSAVDAKIMQHRTAPLEEEEEPEQFGASVPSAKLRTDSPAMQVRTPEDYEVYTLKNLQRNRPSQHYPSKSSSSWDMEDHKDSSSHKPLTTCYSPPSRG